MALLDELLQRLRAAHAAEGDALPNATGDDDPRLAEAVRLIAELAERHAAARGVDGDAGLVKVLFDHIPDMIFVKDAKELRFVRWNAAGQRLVGKSQEELLGRNDYDFFPKEEADFFTSKDREVLDSGELLDIPEEPLHTDNGVRYLHTKKIPVPGPDGKPLYLLGISEDITAQKAAREEAERADAERRRAQEELELLLDHFPGAVWTTDDELRVVSVAGSTPGAFRLDESAVGKPMADHIPSSASAILALHAVSDLGSATYDVHADGRTYQVSVSALSQPAQGQLLWIALDVTERRRSDGELLRARLERSQRLEQLGLLAGGIAHDFNNLLTAVQGNVALAKQRIGGVDGADLLDEALRETEIAGELTQQLLAYAGRGRMRPELVDASDLVRRLAKLIRSSVSKKALLMFDLAEDLPQSSADAAQLRQVVLNLVTNASDALGNNDGRITVKTYAVEADKDMLSGAFVDDGLPGGTYVVIEVRDSGHGMDPETQARAFDPFFSTKERGQGLGLAASLGIVRQHRGTIVVETSQGAGATFRVLLPAAAVAVTHAGAPELGAADCVARVLVVDDESSVRAVAAKALQQAGFTVIEADNGRQALEVIAAADPPIDVVLLDLTMPALSGTEALREIKRFFPDTRVILSSGYAEPEPLARAGAGQAAAFLPKPYTPDVLVAVVRDVLQRNPLSRSG